MPAKQIEFGKEAREKALAGLEKLYRAVSVTLGPGGRNVLFRDSYGSPISTKDGVTVARRVVLKDPFEDAGAQLCKASANRAANAAGDGTTTATVLTWAMVSEGVKFIDAGANATAIRRGMDRCCSDLLKLLDASAQKITTADKELIEAVATISGNSKDVGQLVCEAYLSTSDDAVVIIEASQRPETYLDKESGFSFDEGFEDDYYITNQAKQCVEYENPVILVTNKRIQEVPELAPFLDRVTKMRDEQGNERPLIIISATVETQPRALMVLNKTQANRPWCSVRAPGFDAERRENLEDLAAAIGGEFVPEETQIKLEQIDTSALGTCQRIYITKEKTTIIGGGGDPEKLKAYVDTLKAQLENDSTDEQKKRLEARIARLNQGIAVIKIFAPTVEDLRERAYRYEDSILAVKAALSDGIVPGGGTALIKCAAKLKPFKGTPDEQIGYNLVKNAVASPLTHILKNAGYEKTDGIDQVATSKFWIGWNAATGELENLKKARVLDPVKVTRVALEAAVSTAALYLNTECMIVEDPDDIAPKMSPM